MITNNWQAFQTDAVFIDTSAPTFGLDSIVTLIIIQPLLLLFLSKIYKWKPKNTILNIIEDTINWQKKNYKLIKNYLN